MKKKIIVIAILLLFVIFGIIMQKYIENDKTILIIGNEKIEITKETEEINLLSLQGEKDIFVQKEGIKQVKINGKRIDKNTNIGIIEISSENQLEIEIKSLFGRKRIYKLNTLPKDFPEYTTNGESPYKGDYYITTYNKLKAPYYIFKLNERGNIIYYKKTQQVCFDFKKEFIDNEIKYTYLEVIKPNIRYVNTAYCPTKLVIMNENYEIEKEVMYKKNQSEDKIPLENHGALIIGKEHYILATLEEIEDKSMPREWKKYVDKVTNNKIQEIKDGKIIWEFQTIDYPELYTYTTIDLEDYKSTKCADYAHYNSCAIDKSDGNLLCSFRMFDAIIKIDRKTGQMMWILGGKGDQFNLNEKFAKQHSITSLEDGTLLLFDNGNVFVNNGKINYEDESKIVKIKLDEKGKKIIYYESIKLGANSAFMGSVQELLEEKNTYVICYGGGVFEKNLLEEKNMKTNEIYFSFNFIKSKFLYRVYKIK